MEKTHLEVRIEERAKELFEKDYNDFVSILNRHPVGKLLKVNVNEEQIPLTTFGRNYALFNTEQEQNSRLKLTNYDEVKELLIKKYIAEETDKIIEQLQNIGYLFDN